MKGYYVNKEHFFRKVIGATAFLIEGIIVDTNYLTPESQVIPDYIEKCKKFIRNTLKLILNEKHISFLS